MWYLVLLQAETVQPLCPGQGGVCGAVFCEMGSKPPCSGSPSCSRDVPGVPHPWGLSRSYGRGWGAMGMLCRLYTHGYHCEDALSSKKLSLGAFIHVVRFSLALLMLFG